MIKLEQKNSVTTLKKYKSIAIMLILFSLSTIFPSKAQREHPNLAKRWEEDKNIRDCNSRIKGELYINTGIREN
jgi:hypothetical protein